MWRYNLMPRGGLQDRGIRLFQVTFTKASAAPCLDARCLTPRRPRQSYAERRLPFIILMMVEWLGEDALSAS